MEFDEHIRISGLYNEARITPYEMKRRTAYEPELMDRYEGE